MEIGGGGCARQSSSRRRRGGPGRRQAAGKLGRARNVGLPVLPEVGDVHLDRGGAGGEVGEGAGLVDQRLVGLDVELPPEQLGVVPCHESRLDGAVRRHPGDPLEHADKPGPLGGQDDGRRQDGGEERHYQLGTSCGRIRQGQAGVVAVDAQRATEDLADLLEGLEGQRRGVVRVVAKQEGDLVDEGMVPAAELANLDQVALEETREELVK